MTLEQASFFAEIIAALAVVVSLLYLGIQIKRSRIQSENEAIDMLTNSRSNYIGLLAENTELSYIIPKGLASRTKLTANEYFRYHSYLYTLFVGLEIGFIKWKRKGINDEIWGAWDEATHWWLGFPSVQKWWKENSIGGFTVDFNKYVQSKIDQLKGEPTEELEKQMAFMEEAGKLPKKKEEKQPPA